MGAAAKSCLTVRDLIAWAQFIAATVQRTDGGGMPPWAAYVHGAFLVLLDGLGLGLGVGEAAAAQLRAASLAFLAGQVPPAEAAVIAAASYVTVPAQLSDGSSMPAGVFGAPPFYVPQARALSPLSRPRAV